MSLTGLQYLSINSPNPIHPEFVLRCQAAGIKNVSIRLNETHYVLKTLLSLFREISVDHAFQLSEDDRLSESYPYLGWHALQSKLKSPCERLPLHIISNEKDGFCFPAKYQIVAQGKLEENPVRLP